jgi:DNA (cytosine-5)-methyltransferase 1
MLRLGSLCSGAGGLDLGVEEVFDAETVWHCEINEAASKVLAWWRPVPNHRDLTAADWSRVEPIDILTAGWPCQPWSLAGKQKGAEDERAIWPEIARAIRELRPRYVFLENVSAVVVLGELARAAGDLAEAGYDAQWTCISASDVGSCHKRERFFILATDTQSDRRHERWPESAGFVRGSNAAERSYGDVNLLPTPRTTDSNGPGIHGSGGMDLRTTVALLQTPSVADALGGHLSRSGARSDEQLLPGQAREMASDPPNGPNWGKYGPAIERWEALTRYAPRPTEPNKKGNPRLNPAFSEWMMGWIGGWVTDVPGISRNDQLRIIGNGVVPQQAAAALRWLLNVEVAV